MRETDAKNKNKYSMTCDNNMEGLKEWMIRKPALDREQSILGRSLPEADVFKLKSKE